MKDKSKLVLLTNIFYKALQWLDTEKIEHSNWSKRDWNDSPTQLMKIEEENDQKFFFEDSARRVGRSCFDLEECSNVRV